MKKMDYALLVAWAPYERFALVDTMSVHQKTHCLMNVKTNKCTMMIATVRSLISILG